MEIGKEIEEKVKNCTGEKLEIGMVVYVEPDKRNWLQKLFRIKRKILYIVKAGHLSGVDTSKFKVNQKIYLSDKPGEITN